MDGPYHYTAGWDHMGPWVWVLVGLRAIVLYFLAFLVYYHGKSLFDRYRKNREKGDGLGGSYSEFINRDKFWKWSRSQHSCSPDGPPLGSPKTHLD